MIDATLLFKGTTVFSPWFPRQADMLRVTAECVAVNGATITIKLFTKNRSDPGDGTQVDATGGGGGGTVITLSAVGRDTAEFQNVPAQEGVEELLRFQFDVTGTDNTDWILYRLLPAVWFDAVQA